ncbi:MAG: hypothetical protein AB1640_23245 [bacterium]
MSKAIRVIFLWVAGLLGGVLLACAAVYFFPYAHVSRAERMLAAPESCASRAESFFMEIPGNIVAATHGGSFPFDPFPPGMALLGDPALASGLAVLTKLRDARGEVIGFATELETISPQSSLLRGLLMTDTYWSLILPGRGTVHLYQTENNWKFVKKVVLPAVLKRSPWSGNWPDLHTHGPGTDGRGRIVGGSGEFRGISGSFVEIGTTRSFSPDGGLAGEIELRLCYE